MDCVSAFAGIGGFDRGFEAAGIRVTHQVEIDAHCQAVLHRWWPHVPKGGDIADVHGTDLGSPDLVAGGFPCQDTSLGAPNRAGLAGKRSGQFYEFARLLHELLRLVDDTHCRWVVIENPVGLLTSPGVDRDTGTDRTGWDMAAVARGLEDLGYGWAYRVVDARDTGSAQRRERVIVVGHRGGDPRPAAQVLGLTGGSSEPAGPRPIRPARRPTLVGGAVDDDGTLIFRKSARARAALDKGGYETWRADPYANTLTGFDGGGVKRQTHLIVQDGRVRAPFPVEWERLQGFPDGWTDTAPTSARWRMLGNAMNVPMAMWLGRQLVAVDAALPMLRSA